MTEPNLFNRTLPPDQVRANAIAALQSGRDFILITADQVDGRIAFSVDSNLNASDARAVLTFITARSRYVRPDGNN
jgi:hypothetical protein